VRGQALEGTPRTRKKELFMRLSQNDAPSRSSSSSPDPASAPPPLRPASAVSRRRLLGQTAAAAALGALGGALPDAQAAEDDGPAATRGRIKQSIVHWCFQKHWDVAETCRVARKLGCRSVELVDPQHWPLLKEHGLACAIAGSHGFVQGMNNPKYHAQCIEKLRERIDLAAEHGVPSVITFTGFREDISDEDGQKNCVEGFKKIIGHAEKKKVTLCLEMLNSRVDFEMKGHPGYQGDHTEYCIEIIRRVGSPRLKLLFDIYHVQIMDGDVIQRLRQYHDLIGHYHTAGNPGRGELDDTQEINYRPILEAIAATGYTGYVGQEFIPTRDPLAGLREAVALCDV
jgi:hydroxypyruvate isomerase